MLKDFMLVSVTCVTSYDDEVESKNVTLVGGG